MSQDVQCPHCGWKGIAKEGRMGQSAKCPQCGQFFTLVPTVTDDLPDRPQSNSNLRVNLQDIPKRIREILWNNEMPVYASRPAHSALVLSMLVSGIVWGVIGLGLFVVGIFVTLPLALIITYYSWKNRYYIITKERTITSQGIFNVGVTIVFNRHIELIAINTGIIDRWLGLNTVEISTAAQGGARGIMASFPGLVKGSCQLKSVNVREVIQCYDHLGEV